MSLHMTMDEREREKLRIGDCSLCCLQAVVYRPPETFDSHTTRYAHAAMVRLADHRSTYLPSLLIMTAMQSIRHDIDMPSLASAVVKAHGLARYSFQEYSYSDGIMQRWSFCEAVDLAVGMGEKQEEIMKHLAQIGRRYRCPCEACPSQQRLLNIPRRQDLMCEVQRYQRRLSRKRTVRED